MKAVLISIHPRHCEKIASGKKTVEVRKTAPKIPTPFKCYIYETKGQYVIYQQGAHTKYGYGRGKVIGEFVCDEIEKFTIGGLRCDDIEVEACLTYEEMIAYFYKPEELDGKHAKFGYCWHISDLKIYDKPKELSDYYKSSGECDGCKHLKEVFDFHDYGDGYCKKYKQYLGYYDGYISCEKCYKITRPPQSWCYAEEL